MARPLLPINIINPDTGRSIRYWGLIDTGADCCAAPAVLAIFLGHNLQAGLEKNVSTGNGITKAYGHTTTIEILDHSNRLVYTVDRIIMDYMINLNSILLGVEGFLDRFILTINYQRSIFSIVNS